MIQASLYGRAIRIKQIATKTGKSMTVASCAVSLECRGSDEPETEWIGLCAFGKQAEALAALPDNSMLSAIGKLQVNKYTAANGEERRGLQMIVDQIVTARSVRPGGKAGHKPGPMEYAQAGGAAGDFNDEIPF